MAITFVQGKAGTPAAIQPGFSVIFTSNVTAGNAILVLLTHSYPGTPPSVTDSQGNTYTPQGTHPTAPGSTRFFWIFTAVVGSTAACTVNISYTGGNSQVSYITEYSGLQTNPFDVEITTSTPSTSATTGNMTTTSNGDLIIALFNSLLTSTYTPTNGGVLRLTDSNNAILQDQIQTTAGIIAATATASGGNASYPNYGFGASFKAAAGSSGTPELMLMGMGF